MSQSNSESGLILHDLSHKECIQAYTIFEKTGLEVLKASKISAHWQRQSKNFHVILKPSCFLAREKISFSDSWFR